MLGKRCQYFLTQLAFLFLLVDLELLHRVFMNRSLVANGLPNKLGVSDLPIILLLERLNLLCIGIRSLFNIKFEQTDQALVYLLLRCFHILPLIVGELCQ